MRDGILIEPDKFIVPRIAGKNTIFKEMSSLLEVLIAASDDDWTRLFIHIFFLGGGGGGLQKVEIAISVQ